MKYRFLTLLFIAFCTISAKSPTDHFNLQEQQQALAERETWVNNVFNSLSEDERIGQLFMIRAHSNLGPDHIKKVESLSKEYQVGGLCFFQGNFTQKLK